MPNDRCWYIYMIGNDTKWSLVGTQISIQTKVSDIGSFQSFVSLTTSGV